MAIRERSVKIDDNGFMASDNSTFLLEPSQVMGEMHAFVFFFSLSFLFSFIY